MVKTVEGVNHRGLTDWIIQRVSAIVLAVYSVGLFIFILMHSYLTYSDWHDLFTNFWMKIATLLCVTALLFHAWVGVWTVLTDYVKVVAINWILQIAVVLTLIACFFATLLILWGA